MRAPDRTRERIHRVHLVKHEDLRIRVFHKVRRDQAKQHRLARTRGPKNHSVPNITRVQVEKIGLP